jgi:hypothetical protein
MCFEKKGLKVEYTDMVHFEQNCLCKGNWEPRDEDSTVGQHLLLLHNLKPRLISREAASPNYLAFSRFPGLSVLFFPTSLLIAHSYDVASPPDAPILTCIRLRFPFTPRPRLSSPTSCSSTRHRRRELTKLQLKLPAEAANATAVTACGHKSKAAFCTCQRE